MKSICYNTRCKILGSAQAVDAVLLIEGNLNLSKRAFVLFFILALPLLACQLSAFPFRDQEPGEVLFQDDFSNPDSGWNRVSQQNGETDYADGMYQILVNAPDTDIWARPGLDFNDVQIEVDALKIGGDRNNRFGVICRAEEPDRFYVFIISSDGYYGIGKIRGQNYELIGMEALQPSDKINVGSAGNHLRADCVGTKLSLYVNGELLREVEDAEFASGDVGLIAGTYNIPGTDIRFDNFSVLQP